MSTRLYIPTKVYQALEDHLIPFPHDKEEAAFLFVSTERGNEELRLSYVDWYPVVDEDYSSRSPHHFELKHETNGKIIKKAHDLGASIVEFHSHIDQERVRFSHTDWTGFQEFVPYVRWRLQDKPYGAVVMAKNGIDALIWESSNEDPIRLEAIEMDEKELTPTHNSLKQIGK